jgi:hypothetical protein
VRAAVYDSGALISAERGDGPFWDFHRGLIVYKVVPIVPTPVLAQVWRGGSRQVRLRFLLRGCDIEPFTRERAEATGQLLRASRTDDVVDASVVECARRWSAAVITGDREDIEHLLEAAGISLVVEQI